MSKAEHSMKSLMDDSDALGLPAQDLAELVQANVTGNRLESVMRLRALTELSAQLDSTTLMALAALATRGRGLVADMVLALDRPRH